MTEPPAPIRPAIKLLALGCALGTAGLLWVVARSTADQEQDAQQEARDASGQPNGDGLWWGDPGSRGEHARWGDPTDGGVAFGSGPAASRSDPQLEASQRSLGGPDSGVTPHFYATTRAARVASVSGEAPVGVGSHCDVRVLPVMTSEFNCLVRVVCDGVVLYPDPSERAGYAPCQVRDGTPTRAVDDGHTREDGDPTVDLDLQARRVVVTDDGPGVVPFVTVLTLDRIPEPG